MSTANDKDYPQFPHLENLNRAQVVLDAPRVRISEKIDGFNARFGRTIGGEIWAGTRNRVIDLETEPTQGFADFVKRLVVEGEGRFLLPGETLFGEWAGKGIQKRINYGDPDFYLFAIKKVDGTWASPFELEAAALTLEIKLAPVLWDGAPLPLDFLAEMRQGPSIVAPGDPREGIVIWPIPMTVDKFGHQLIAKYKNPDFEERASQRRSAPVTFVDLTNVKAFVAEYATEERFAHVLRAVGQGVSAGQPVFFDPLAPEMTGEVLRGMYQDVCREGGDDYEALSEDDQKAVGKVLNPITKGYLDAARNAALAEAVA